MLRKEAAERERIRSSPRRGSGGVGEAVVEDARGGVLEPPQPPQYSTTGEHRCWPASDSMLPNRLVGVTRRPCTAAPLTGRDVE
jgi:hypothetical protein